MAAVQYSDQEILTKVIKDFEEDAHHHDYFVRLYEKRERSYRGVKERVERPKWKHNNRPPYAFNLLETVVANQIEMGLTFEAKPNPMSNMTPDEAQHMLLMAEDVEHLLRHEHRIDLMDQKQRPLFLCEGIGGVGIGKTYWNYTTGKVTKQGVQETVVHNGDGSVAGTMPTIVEIEQQDAVIRDHSTTEIIDPRDFIWNQSAADLDPRAPRGAMHLFHRCWYSYEQLQMLHQINPQVWKDPAFVKESRDFTEAYHDRETELFNVNKTKDLIEVLEYWWFENNEIHTVSIAGRKGVICPIRSNPFWHQQYPFFISTSMPQPFSLRGVSTIELIADLQEILWELGNQRLDNVELINNAIMLIRSDVDDPDAFEHYPGARWQVDDTAQVAPLMPPYQVAQVSLEAESLLKGDLQNVTSAAPFAGGAQTQSVDQKTATGASIVMNAAQQQLAMKKHYAQFGLQREANLRLKNCQQYLDPHMDRLVHILGPGGAMAFKSIPPLAIQGEYLLELTPMSESQQRQEKRAEASNFAQLMIGFAPIAAAAGQPIDVQAVIKWFCDKWEIEYPEQFFASNPPAAMGAAGMGGPPGAGPPGAGGPPGAPAPPGGPNLGVTASSAVDASAPSATGGLSMSPAMFLQRAMALGKSQTGPRS